MSSYVGHTNPATAGTASTTVINTPAGVVAGHLLIAILRLGNTTATTTPPAGWELLHSVPNAGSANRLLVYKRTAVSGEPASHTWTHSAAVSQHGGILAYSDAEVVVSSTETGNASGAQTPHSPSSVTLPRALTAGIAIAAAVCSVNSLFGDSWPGTATTLRWTSGNDANNRNFGARESNGIVAPQGAYTPPNIQHGSSSMSHDWAGVTIVLDSPPPPPPPPAPAGSIVFDAPNERYFMHGIDRGVIYPPGKPAVPWNGLTGVDESSDASKTIYYRDGAIFLADVDPGDYEGVVNALFYPDEFSECLGIPEIAEGLYVDNQKPKRFGLAYRTLIGSGEAGDMFGYQIHLIYNAVAVIGTRSRRSMNKSSEFTEMTFDLTATPIKLPGIRPSAHYIIDTRHLGPAMTQQLEDILYGTDSTAPRLPLPQELFDIMAFGDTIIFTLVDADRGVYRVSAASKNLYQIRPGVWQLKNVNGIDHGDGSYTVSDTP